VYAFGWRRRRALDHVESEEPTDHELLRRIGLRDESALETLYTRYGGLLCTLALRIVGDRELALEVLQDTFLRAWRESAGYDPERGRVPWWLMGITRNRAIDLLRSRTHQARLRERPEDGTSQPEPAQADGADDVVLRRTVEKALHGLTTVQRQAIELAYYGGLTQAEIASQLGEPLGTVKSRTREAMDRLRSVLLPVIEPTRERKPRD
jgi:RNA polymerase sigma-70 factor (ECF subfamily)